MAPKKPKSAPKAAAKKAAAKKAVGKTKAGEATIAQQAQKRIAADLKRKKEKAANPNASQKDKELGAAAAEVEAKYKSLGHGDKASFALELSKKGIQPGKLQWMATYGKSESAIARDTTSVDKGMMTRYLY